jgi:hypothetical protein
MYSEYTREAAVDTENKPEPNPGQAAIADACQDFPLAVTELARLYAKRHSLG